MPLRGLGEERGPSQILPHHSCALSKAWFHYQVTAICITPGEILLQEVGTIVLWDCDTQNCHSWTPDTISQTLWCVFSGRKPLSKWNFVWKQTHTELFCLNPLSDSLGRTPVWSDASLWGKKLRLRKVTCFQTSSQPPLVTVLLPWGATSVLLRWTLGTCHLSKCFIGDYELHSGLGSAG